MEYPMIPIEIGKIRNDGVNQKLKTYELGIVALHNYLKYNHKIMTSSGLTTLMSIIANSN